MAHLVFTLLATSAASLVLGKAIEQSRQDNRHVNAPVSEAGRINSRAGSSYRLTDYWHGAKFFDGWDFFAYPDPTRGLVEYVDRAEAQALKLAYVDASGRAIMKVDSTNNLARGQNRRSVRISTQKSYDGGLFVLNATHLPFGCAVWPAFWMVGPDWPSHGEIDIIEGVNLFDQNRYTAHTSAGCSVPPQYSGDIPAGYRVYGSRTVPDGSSDSSSTGSKGVDCGPNRENTGCSFQDNDETTFGSGANQGGDTVVVMEWNSDGIRIWNFPDYAVPLDLYAKEPNPDLWGSYYLKAAWPNVSKWCNTNAHFAQMQIVFDITLCGYWAGADYPGSRCPGTCQERVMTGSNFKDAFWAVNSVKVYT